MGAASRIDSTAISGTFLLVVRGDAGATSGDRLSFLHVEVQIVCRWIFVSVLVVALLLAPSQFVGPRPAIAHGGGLDSLGCHNDRKRGGYHCHQGPLAGRDFVSKPAAVAALRGAAATAPKSPSTPVKPPEQPEEQ